VRCSSSSFSRALILLLSLVLLSCSGEDSVSPTNGPEASPDDPTGVDGGSEARREARIAFASSRDRIYEIHVMDADGSGQTRLTHSTEAINQFPIWSPDATRILFLGCLEGDAHLFVMNADGSNQTRLAPAFSCGVDTEIPDWSPDGGQIVYVGDNFLRIINADGTGSRRLTSDDSDSERSPAWSPNGRRIAFARGRNVHVIKPDGSQPRQLTDEPSFTSPMPAWSPNNRRIAFVSHRDGNFEIYTMNADGTRQTRLTNAPDACPTQPFDCGDQQPAWSPNGRKIVFTSDRDGNDEIYVMNANGTRQTRLTNNVGRDVKPQWSRNGKKILFTSNRDGNPEIYIMNADGTGQTNLSQNAAEDFDADLSR
jgi:Tol biopolymer transport system component